VLNAFKLINDGIAATNLTLTGKNNDIMAQLKGKYDNDPVKTAPFLDDARRVKQFSADFNTYVEELKQQMIRESGGMDNGQLKNKKDTETPTRVMVEKAKGKELQQKIQTLREELTTLKTLNAGDKSELLKSLSLSTEYDHRQAEKLDKKDWSSYHFEKVPVVAAVALLTKIQGDAKNSEAMVLNMINEKTEGKVYRFDVLKPASFIPSSYVIAGKQQYKADIFIAATSTTQETEVFMGQFKDNSVRGPNGQLMPKLSQNPLKDGYKKVEVTDGVASYEETPAGTGDMTRQGVIKVKQPTGTEYDYYPFELKYQSAKPTAVVSPVKMNVLYIGLDNPLAISVPGVPADKLIPSVAGDGTISGSNGEYVIKVNKMGKIKVNVAAKMEEGDRDMGSTEFRVKLVPKPEIRLENFEASKIKPDKIKICRKLNAVLENFEYNVNFEIMSFQMMYVAKNGNVLTKDATGSVLTPDMLKLINMAKNGDVYYFDEIRVKFPGGEIFKINNVTYKVI
jgi:gliding motility-associated protein GldM